MSYPFKYMRSYTGPLRAAILDWSGTTADKYVLAPAVVFVDVFAKHKVPISMAEARLPMGLRKDLHIKEITEDESVRKRWKEVHGTYPGQAEVDAMFKDFVPMQLACLRSYAGLLPNCAETIKRLKTDFNMKIGSTTGFTKVMVDVLLEEAKKQGYEPDSSVAGDEVIHGARPGPFMIYKNLDMLGVTPIQSVVKVDDTVSGIGEAQNAGCWGVGIAKWSNYMDIDSFEHEASLTPAEMQKRLEKSREILHKSGAHYVIDTIDELPDVCAKINARLANGETPY